MKLLNTLESLPNQDGFKFIGVDRTGSKFDCVVCFNQHSLSYCAYKIDGPTMTPCFSELTGWEHITNCEQKQ